MAQQKQAAFQDPLRSFRFLVQVEGGDDSATAAFSNFSGIRMNVQTVQGRDGSQARGVQDYVPVLTQFEPVTLSRGVAGSYAFLDWLFAAAASDQSGPTGKNLRRTVNVLAVDEQGKHGVMWSLKDAMPIGYAIGEMDSMRSDVLVESLTLAYTGMTREVL